MFIVSHVQSCSEMPLTADIHQLGRLMVQCSWTCVSVHVKGSWSGRNESTDREETSTEGEGETWREPSTAGTESSRGASWHSPSWRLTMLNYLLNLRTHWQWKVNPCQCWWQDCSGEYQLSPVIWCCSFWQLLYTVIHALKCLKVFALLSSRTPPPLNETIDVARSCPVDEYHPACLSYRISVSVLFWNLEKIICCSLWLVSDRQTIALIKTWWMLNFIWNISNPREYIVLHNVALSAKRNSW